MKLAPTDPRGRRRVLIVIVVLILVILALLVGNAYVFNVFMGSGDMMAPAIDRGDIIVNYRLAYRFGDPQRGDLVAFRLPGSSEDSTCTFVRRIVGLPGETLSLEDGRLCVDGRPLDEPYLQTSASGSAVRTEPVVYDDAVPADDWAAAAPAWMLFRPFNVPNGSFYLLADDRGQGGDSRIFGPVGRDEIAGRILWH